MKLCIFKYGNIGCEFLTRLQMNNFWWKYSNDEKKIKSSLQWNSVFKSISVFTQNILVFYLLQQSCTSGLSWNTSYVDFRRKKCFYFSWKSKFCRNMPNICQVSFFQMSKIFLILYPSPEFFTTGTTIMYLISSFLQLIGMHPNRS